jgi:dephospho-CoA kinase
MESAIALEKPLFNGVYDAVLLVTAPERQRIERACRRDGTDPEAVRARMALQRFDPMRADAVVNNDQDPEVLRHRTDIALKILSL